MTTSRAFNASISVFILDLNTQTSFSAQILNPLEFRRTRTCYGYGLLKPETVEVVKSTHCLFLSVMGRL